MRIVAIINSDSLALPSIHWLKAQELLYSVGILKKNKPVLLPQLLSLGWSERQVHFIDKATWKTEMTRWLVDLSADAVFVFGFPYQIPLQILTIPKLGFYNFHYGAMPKYKGADPIFWQIKNKEEHCELIVHQMNSEVDEGPIAWSKCIQILSGENYAMLCERLGAETASSMPLIVEAVKNQSFSLRQSENLSRVYDKKPSLSDLTIDWHKHEADEIESLVNATNYKYGGAVTYLEGREFRLLEVSSVAMDQATEQVPGCVVYADHLYGVVVSCLHQKFLRIGVAHLKEGYFSGSKLFSIGIKVGMRFN